MDLFGLFRIQQLETRPYEKFDNTWVSVTVEMDLNVVHYERNVYTFFDMLSDVGGLNGILVTILAMFATLWNYNSFDNFMVSRLFKIQKPDEDIDSYGEFFNNQQRPFLH